MPGRISDQVYAETEPDRHRLEVEFVAKKDAEWIKTHLVGVQEKRGFEAYKKLRDDLDKFGENNGYK
jgi:hypothetical protein